MIWPKLQNLQNLAKPRSGGGFAALGRVVVRFLLSCKTCNSRSRTYSGRCISVFGRPKAIETEQQPTCFYLEKGFAGFAVGENTRRDNALARKTYLQNLQYLQNLTEGERPWRQ